MKNYDANLAAELRKEIFRFFFTVELQFSTTYKLTDSDVKIVHGANVYTPWTFRFSSINYSSALSVDNMTIEFGNADLTMSALLLNEDVRNKVAIVSMGAVNANGIVISVDVLFRGFIGDWDIKEDSVVLTIVNELVLWQKKAIRTASATCPWNFKQLECAYAGEQVWCDQSYERCAALGNTINFGGHRFLPAMSERQIWWGKVPK
jgi:hypothetical protein